jgi:hypothetical protein
MMTQIYTFKEMNESLTDTKSELDLVIEAATKVNEKYGHLPKAKLFISEAGDSTENAKKSLQAILGMFKGKEDNDIYKMGKGIMDYFKDKGSFAPNHAKWIWKTSVALFKK